MKYQPLINTILKAVNDSRVLAPYNKEIFSQKPDNKNNEFLFFIKPEITLNDKNIKLPDILRMVLEKLDEYSFYKTSIRVINAKYLKTHKIINQHYGVISKLSSDLKKFITQSARDKFKVEYGIDFDSANVLGSIEFLKKFQFYTPTALSMLWQNSSFAKLSGGTYSQKLSFDGEDIYLVNGFHPRQLEHFTTPGRCIIVMNLVSDTNWDIARNKLIGKTNPKEAEKGSIRNLLYAQKDKFGLKNISSSWNGVHLSAGPIEALVELIRYNTNHDSGKSIDISSFQFGNQLINEIGEKKSRELLKNPTVLYNDNKESVFDLTEEINSSDCINLVKELNF